MLVIGAAGQTKVSGVRTKQMSSSNPGQGRQHKHPSGGMLIACWEFFRGTQIQLTSECRHVTGRVLRPCGWTTLFAVTSRGDSFTMRSKGWFYIMLPSVGWSRFSRASDVFLFDSCKRSKCCFQSRK